MRTKNALLLCALLLMPSLGIAHDFRVDYDRSAGFYKYQTFMWVNAPDCSNAWMSERIINAVNAQLQARGMRLVTSNADLAVSAKSDTRAQGFYAGLAGGWNWYYYWYPQPSITVVDTLDSRALVVNLTDTHTGSMVWWGIGLEAMDEKHFKHLNGTVKEMFEYLPPVADREG